MKKGTIYFTIFVITFICATSLYAQQNDISTEQRIQLRQALLSGNQRSFGNEIKAPFRNSNSTRIQLKTDNYIQHLTPRNTGNNELSSYYVNDAFIDSQGRFYFKSNSYTNYALDVFDTNDDSWSHLEVGEELPARVNTFVEVSASEVWIGTNDGMYKYNSSYVLEDSLDLETDSMPSNRIGDLLIDSNNHIWAVQNSFFTREYNLEGGIDTVYFRGGITLFDATDKTIIARSDTMNSGLEETIGKNGIRDIASDSDGNVWATTDMGIAVYASDGSSASSYTTGNSDLPSNDVNGVEADGNGTIWVSFPSDTTNVLASFDGQDWTIYTTADLPFEYCNSLTVGTGDMLYCSEEALYSYDGTAWSEVTGVTVKGVTLENAISITSNNGVDIFIPEGPGVFINDGGNWDYLSTHTDNGLYSNVIFGESTDAQGGLWTTGFYGAAYYDGMNWTYYDTSNGLASMYSWKIHAASDGTVWFGGSEGIFYLKDGVFSTYEEIPEYLGEDIYEDRGGNIWFGSFSYSGDPFEGGILQYDGTDFNFFPMDTTTIKGVNLSFAQGPDDMVYATSIGYFSGSNNIIRYDGTEWSVWNPDSSVTVGYTKLAVDNDHNLYFRGSDTTNTYKLYKWDGVDLTDYDLPEQCSSSTEAMEADANNNIWMECWNKVVIFNIDDESWVTHEVTPVTFDPIYDIKHDGNGRTWVATYGSGLFKFNTSRAVSNEEIALTTPEEFQLNQNYPNPFNPSTVISYQLPINSRVTLKVYDLLGREVITLLNANRQTAGQHQVTFDASQLASGMYIYRLSSNNFTATRKMMLIK